VRRIEVTPIGLEVDELPFDPAERHAFDFARSVLDETGGFDGLLPIGHYRIGHHGVDVVPGLTPVTVQRVLGDGDSH
jgi:hypothetical protein